MPIQTEVVVASKDSRRPAALQGVQIQSRDPQVRAAVMRLYRQAPWLSAVDVPAAIRYIILSKRFNAMADFLKEQPVTTVQGQPRKLDAELRATSAELSRLERDLGLTASARAALGVDLARMQDLASAMSQGESHG